MISGAQGSTSAALGQLQMQQAQRNAEQAELRAQALQTQARAAQQEAVQAQRNASELQSNSVQARGDADNARRNVSTLQSVGEINTQLGALREQIANVLSPPATEALASAAFTNVEGQTTGTLINVTA